MPDRAVSSLEPRWQRLLADAAAALARREYEAVREAGRALLTQAPGCVAARRVYQQARDASAAVPVGAAERLRAVWQACVFLLPTGDLEARIRRADDVLDRFPQHGTAWAAIAHAAARLDWPETALFALDRLARLQPDEPGVLRRQAELHLQLGQASEAKAVAERWCNLRPQDPAALQLLRQACVALGLATATGTPTSGVSSAARGESEARGGSETAPR